MKKSFWYIAAMMIFFSQFFYVLPFAENIPYTSFGRYLAIILLMFGIFFRNILIYKSELFVMAILIIMSALFFMIQSIALNDYMIIRNSLQYYTMLLTMLFLVKTIGYKKIINLFIIFTVANVILLAVWMMLGQIEIYEYRVLPFNPHIGISFMGLSMLFSAPDNSLVDLSYLHLRFSSFTENPNAFAFYAAVGFTGMFIRKDYTKREKRLCFLLFILVMIATQSRAAGLFALTFIASYRIIKLKSDYGKILYTFISVFSIFTLVIGMSLIRDSDEISSGRFDTWNYILDTYINGLDINILFGIGFNMLDVFLSKLSGGLHVPVDNSYIPFLLEVGVVGVVCLYSSIIICVIYLKKSGFIDDVLLAFFIAILCYSMVEKIFFLGIKSYVWMLYLFYSLQLKCNLTKKYDRFKERFL